VISRRGLAALGAAAILVSACSFARPAGRSPGTEPAATRSASSGPSIDAAATTHAIDLLRAGTRFVDQTSFRTDFAVAGQSLIWMHTDSIHKRGVGSISAPAGPIELRLVDDDFYMNAGSNLRGVAEGWMILDVARIPAGFAFTFAPGSNDPGGSARFINGIISAEVTGAHISGTIDLSKVGVGSGFSFKPGPDGSFQGGPHRPFSATLDSEGRVVSLRLPKLTGDTFAEIRYSEFGVPVDVSPPTGAVPAPDALYPQLGVPG